MNLQTVKLGIVGVAMGTVLIPELTRAVRGGDHSAVAHAESRGLELAVGLALPSTLGLMVLSEPIVRLLFEHGAFTSADTAATARALAWPWLSAASSSSSTAPASGHFGVGGQRRRSSWPRAKYSFHLRGSAEVRYASLRRVELRATTPPMPSR